MPATVWINNGGIVLTNGSIVLCAECPCAGCPYCDNTPTPDSVLLEFDGVVDGGGCFDCDYWNTNSFELLRVADCVWSATVDGPGCLGGPYILTYIVTENHVQVTILNLSEDITIFDMDVATPIDCDNVTGLTPTTIPSLFACGFTFATASILPA
jgi:hypothetical protein